MRQAVVDDDIRRHGEGVGARPARRWPWRRRCRRGGFRRAAPVRSRGRCAGRAAFRPRRARTRARSQMVSSARPSVVVKICASTILAPGGGAGAGDDRQQPGMVGRDHREFGDAAEGVGRHFGRERMHFHRAGVQQQRVLDFVRQIDLEPIGRIMPRRIVGEFVVRPGRQLVAQFVLAIAATRRLRSTEEWPPASTTSVSQ